MYLSISGYDYTQSGWYFVTVCTENRESLFGQIVGANHDSPNVNNGSLVRAIHESPLQIQKQLRKRSLLSQIIGYLKMNSAKLIHQINPNIPVWQRNPACRQAGIMNTLFAQKMI